MIFQNFPEISKRIFNEKRKKLENYIKNSRLRSRRTKIRIIREAEEKFIRKQDKHSRKLWKIRRDLPLVPLDEPYQKGFVRFFVLREDIQRGKYAEFFQTILDKINSFDYCDNRKFLKKKRRRGKKIYVPRPQNLRKIPVWQFPEYKNLKFSEKEQKYFIKTEEYNSHTKKWETFWEFRDKWMFVLRVKPYMITHYKPVDCELESEIARLDKYLDQHRIRGILRKKVWGGRSWTRYEKEFVVKEKHKYNSLKNNNLHRIKMTAMEISALFDE